MFIFGILFSIIVGLAASKLGMFGSTVVCVFGGVIGMFFGIAMGWVRHSGEESDLKGKLALVQMMGDVRCRREVTRAVQDTKKECSGFVIEAARAVANRVANRMIARHAPGLLNEEQREATLSEADQIVSEELVQFQEAMGTGIKKD